MILDGKVMIEKTVLTPRLRLTLLESAEVGSDDVRWMYELQSDPLCTQWRYGLLFTNVRQYFSANKGLYSMHGMCKTIEDTRDYLLQHVLPIQGEEQDQRKHRVAYVVHKLRTDDKTTHDGKTESKPEELLGVVTFRPSQGIPLTDDFTVDDKPGTGVLKLVMGYMFLPSAWGKGYATETLGAALGACKRSTNFWFPWKKVYFEGFVSPDNPASMRVMEKSGTKHVGTFVWEGEPVFLAGAWRECKVNVYSCWIVE